MVDVRCVNITEFERWGMHTTVLPLPDGFLLPTDAQGSLTAHDATASGSTDWVQWWPMTSPGQAAAGSNGWLYPSGYMRMVKVCFPLHIDAGVAGAGPVWGSPVYPRYKDKTVSITKTPSTPQLWFPGIPIWNQVYLSPGGLRFVLDDGLGHTDEMLIDPANDEEIYAAPGASGAVSFANVRVYRKRQRMTVPNPQTDNALWHECIYELQRDLASDLTITGGSNRRVIRFWYSWGCSDPRTTEVRHICDRVTVGVELFGDPYFLYEEARLPEWVPTVYNAGGNGIVTPGSGSSKFQPNPPGPPPVQNLFTNFALFDPDDRTEVNGISRNNREPMMEGTAQVNYGVMLMPYPVMGSGLPNEVLVDEQATMDAERTARVQGIAQNWPDELQNFGAFGYVPPYDVRNADFASREESYAAACAQAKFEYEYHRSAGVAPNDWPHRDPLSRCIEGPRPDTSKGGDAAGFGFSKGFKEASSGCGDLRALEVSAHQYLANFSLSLREADVRFITPQDWVSADTYAHLKEASIPLFNGQPGIGATWNSAITTTSGVTIQSSNWGKFHPPPQNGGQAVQLGKDGDTGNHWTADENIEGGFNKTHHDIVAFCAYVQLTGDHWALQQMDGIRQTLLGMDYHPRDDDSEEYWLAIQGPEPEDPNINGGPFMQHNRAHGRMHLSVNLIHRLLGDVDSLDHLVTNTARLFKRYAVGSQHREFTWYDPNRWNVGWPFRREFTPFDLDDGDGTRLQSWARIGYDITNTSQLTATSGTRKYLTMIKNHQGFTNRNWINTDPAGTHGAAWWDPALNGEFDSDKFDTPVAWPDRYTRHTLVPIACEKWPLPVGGGNAFGCTFDQPGTSGPNFGGEFYVAVAFLHTRNDGIRDLFGTDPNHFLKYDAEPIPTAHITLVVGGTSHIIATDVLTPGTKVLLEVFRHASNVVECYVNGVSVGTNPTVSGNWNPVGFGWSQLNPPGDQSGNSYCDDYINEWFLVKGATDDQDRMRMREYMRTQWDIYDRELLVTDITDYELRIGQWHLVPTSTAPPINFDPQQTQLSDPGTVHWQMGILLGGMYSTWLTLRTIASPTALEQEAIDFSREWLDRGARWFAMNGMASNIENHPGFVLPVPWMWFSLAIDERFWTSPETRFELGQDTQQPFSVDPENPAEFLIFPAGSWRLCKEIAVAYLVAINDLSADKGMLLRALQTLTAVIDYFDVGQPVFAQVGQDRNRYGWGDHAVRDAQADPWLHVGDMFNLPPISDTHHPIHMTGAGTMDSTPVVDPLPVVVAMVGVGVLDPLEVILVPATPVEIIVQSEIKGASVMASVPLVDAECTSHMIGSGRVVASPVQTFVATSTMVGTSVMSAAVLQDHIPSSTMIGVGTMISMPQVGLVSTTHMLGAGTMVSNALREQAPPVAMVGSGVMVSNPIVDAAVSSTMTGSGVMVSVPLIDPEVTTHMLGAGVMNSAGVEISGPTEISITKHMTGVGTMLTSPDVVAPLICTLHMVGIGTVDRSAFVEKFPIITGERIDLAEDALDIIQDIGFSTVYYPAASEEQIPVDCHVDFLGVLSDGTSRDPVAEVWVARTEERGILTAQAGDLIDIPFVAGGTRRRGRVRRVIEQAPNVFRLEVQN